MTVLKPALILADAQVCCSIIVETLSPHQGDGAFYRQVLESRSTKHSLHKVADQL